MNIKTNYYFTFGTGQVNENCYYVVKNADYGEARERMFDVFGVNWLFQYSEDEWIDKNGISQAVKYNYKKINNL